MTAVHHIGSTVIGGLVAQPTIDAIAVVDEVEGQEAAADLIEGLNFRRLKPPMWAADAIHLRKPRHVAEGEVPTHEIYVVLDGSPTMRRTIAVRDYLLNDRETALRFEAVKVARWREGEGDPERYAADKATFFAHLEELAGM